MVDATTEHYKTNSLATAHYIVRMEMTYDTPRQVARDLHHRMLTTASVAQHDQIALVVLARVIAKRRVEVARGVADAQDLAASSKDSRVRSAGPTFCRVCETSITSSALPIAKPNG